MTTIDLGKLVAAIPAVADKAMREAIPHQYTPELAAQIAETTIGILTGTLCPVWPTICTDTTPGHYDHFNHEQKVNDKDGEEILAVGFVENSGGDGPVMYIGSEEVAASEVRAKTAELRQLLDKADAMADQVIAMQEVRS